MKPTIVLHGIQFSGVCGVTPNERIHPQPLVIDLEIESPHIAATHSDNLDDTIDYARIVELVIQVGTQSKYSLLESLAERVCRALCEEFSLSRVQIWVRKVAPPLPDVHGSVGVRLTHVNEFTRLPSSNNAIISPPSRFFLEQFHHLPKGRILDVATGTGRHALYLAARGFSVVGIDRDAQALAMLKKTAQDCHLNDLIIHQVDLESNPADPPEIGHEEFDGIIVFSYLFRLLFPSLLRALKPDGVLIYETFLIDNHRIHHHPRRTEFCLEHNELLGLVKGLRILHYQEGEHEPTKDENSVFTARLVAKKDRSMING